MHQSGTSLALRDRYRFRIHSDQLNVHDTIALGSSILFVDVARVMSTQYWRDVHG